MRKQAVGAILWNLVGLLFSLSNGVLTARLLVPGDRGVLALAITISSMSYVVSSMGTNAAVKTFQPTATWASFRTYARVSARLIGVNAAAVGFALVLFRTAGTMPTTPWVVAVVILLGLANFVSSQLLEVLNTVGRNRTSAAVNSAGHGLTATALFVLFLTHIDSVSAAIGAYLLGFVGRTLISLVIVRADGEFALGDRAADGGKQLFTQGLKFWGMTLGQAVAFRIDLLLLGVISSAHVVGIYAVAVTPASLTQVISNSLGQVIYREAAVGRLRLRRLALWALLAFGVAGTYSVVLALVAPWAIPLVFGSEYIESVPVVRILLIGETALAPYLVLVRGLAGSNAPWWASVSGVLGSAVMFAAVVLLTPPFGVVGAALGVSLSYVSMLLISVVGLVFLRRARRRG